MRFTPNNISHLEDNEVFVFGSNEAGIHGAGAARLAFEKFGAVWKIGVGHEGKTYAIPTKDYVIKTLDLIEIKIRRTLRYFIETIFFCLSILNIFLK
jgi:hypothetical protein